MNQSKPHIQVSILDFLRSGSFGPIHLGMTRQDLEVILGRPEQFGGQWPSEVIGQVKAPKNPSHPEDYPIWKYGIVEFYWGEKSHLLYMIHFDDTANELGLQTDTEVIRYDAWLFGEHRPLLKEQLEQGLIDAGITYRVSTEKVYGELILPSGVVAAFDYDGEYKDQITVITQTDEQYEL